MCAMTFCAPANGRNSSLRTQLAGCETPLVTRIKVSPMRPCNACGRPAPYVVYYGHRWGWRLCWEHVPMSAVPLLTNVIKGSENREA